MNLSSAVNEKRLPDKANKNYIWKEVDKTHNTECFDGEKRECGSIRIMPSLLNIVDTPIPKKYLGNNLSKVNLDPFLGFSEFGLIFWVESDIDCIDSHLWSRTPVSEFLPPEEAEKIEDNLIGLCLVNSKLDSCIFKRKSESSKVVIYELENKEIVETIDSTDISFFDVPDDALLEHIPDDYISDLVSREI